MTAEFELDGLLFLAELEDPDSEAGQRAFAAMLRMKKLDIAELKRAYAG